MKICVLGAGALGCAIGAALSEAGADVWLINRGQAHVAAMNAQGLTLVGPGAERRVRVKAATTCAGIGTVDLIIVLVKSFDTREAIAGAAPSVGAPWRKTRSRPAAPHSTPPACLPPRCRPSTKCWPTRKRWRVAWWWNKTTRCWARSGCPICHSLFRLRHLAQRRGAIAGPAQS